MEDILHQLIWIISIFSIGFHNNITAGCRISSTKSYLERFSCEDLLKTPNHAVQHLVLQVAYVKEHSGHREFEVQRELVAAVKEMSAERCRAILQWGKNNLGPKADEELKLG